MASLSTCCMLEFYYSRLSLCIQVPSQTHQPAETCATSFGSFAKAASAAANLICRTTQPATCASQLIPELVGKICASPCRCPLPPAAKPSFLVVHHMLTPPFAAINYEFHMCSQGQPMLPTSSQKNASGWQPSQSNKLTILLKSRLTSFVTKQH